MYCYISKFSSVILRQIYFAVGGTDAQERLYSIQEYVKTLVFLTVVKIIPYFIDMNWQIIWMSNWLYHEPMPASF